MKEKGPDHDDAGEPRSGARLGEHSPGRGRGGPRRMFEHGDLRLILLSILNERASYGFELIKVLEEKFDGAYAPGPMAVYPILTMLDEQSLINRQGSTDTLDPLNSGSKRRYAITEPGKTLLTENRERLDGIFTRIQMSGRSEVRERPPEILSEAMHTLKQSIMLHAGSWTDDQIKRIASIVNQAARDVASS